MVLLVAMVSPSLFRCFQGVFILGSWCSLRLKAFEGLFPEKGRVSSDRVVPCKRGFDGVFSAFTGVVGVGVCWT